MTPFGSCGPFFVQKLKIIEKEGSSTTKQPKRSGDMTRSYSAVNQKKEKNYGV